MPNSPHGPIRRAQLIVPFGVGAMVNVPGGTSLVVAGLDYWYKSTTGNEVEEKEFRIEEWRLQKILQVSHFRLPPDYRQPRRGSSDQPNLKLTIPGYRFPTWHFCSTCKLLIQKSMYDRGKKGKIRCPECQTNGKVGYLYQVPFIAICENGHLNDFPWNEWVHRSANPTCEGNSRNKLRLISTGSASLSGQKVKCLECGTERSLAGITYSNEGVTTLSAHLEDDGEFSCLGERPWLGPNMSENCSAQLKGSLRSASNVYFGHVRSSIYLPRTNNRKTEQILELLENPPLSTLFQTLIDLKATDDLIVDNMRSQQSLALKNYTKEEIINAIQVVRDEVPSDEITGSQSGGQDDPLLFRKEEFDILRVPRNDDLLKIKDTDISDYSSIIGKYFSRITLIDKLRETRVFAGFSRIYAENDQDIEKRKTMLWKTLEKGNSWLPAYLVYGEGIFLEFEEESLRRWEALEGVNQRIETLVARYRDAQERRHLNYRPIGPRYLLIHTFSHLLMNQLTFDCGYSSAALRERLYVSEDEKNPMAGLLIYTADGDAEGTMGGLVRMGKPGRLEPVIQTAIESARWCSADPVCMEMGNMHGQGPDSCNLAACHNCALVPETACEDFNRFLDRGVLIGDINDPSIGYFNI